MNHSTTDEEIAKATEGNDSVAILHTAYPYRDEPLPRAKPHERITRGIEMEKFFGVCADEFDDEFMEGLLTKRRRERPGEPR